MRQTLKQICLTGTAGFSIQWLKNQSSIRTLIPYHHLVSDEPVPYINSLYAYKNIRQFETDLDYLLKHFQPLSLQEVITRSLQDHTRSAQSGLSRPSSAAQNSGHFDNASGFLITFDDGLRQVYDVAAPILLRKGIPAAFFINPSFVDNKSIFYRLQVGWLLHALSRNPPTKTILEETGKILGSQIRSAAQMASALRSIHYGNQHQVYRIAALMGVDLDEFAKRHQPFMTTSQLRKLQSQGFSLGAHSIDHPLYTAIPSAEQIRQTRASTDWVAETFALSYRAFAFPHVDTGVGEDFFSNLLKSNGPLPKTAHTLPAIDLILGNQTGMMERSHRVLHRFIGEDPRIPMERMAKAVLLSNILRRTMGKQYVAR